MTQLSFYLFTFLALSTPHHRQPPFPVPTPNPFHPTQPSPVAKMDRTKERRVILDREWEGLGVGGWWLVVLGLRFGKEEDEGNLVILEVY